MIWHTIAQAAERVHREERTIRTWVRNGDLPVKAHPLVPGVVFVDEGDLLDTERAIRRRARATRFQKKLQVSAGTSKVA